MSATTETLTAPQVLERATQAWRAGRPKEAATLCDALVKAGVATADALNLLGLALFSTDRKAEAREALEKALAMGERPDVLNNLGVVLKSLDEPLAAQDRFERALTLKPDYGEAHANFGRLLRATGNLGGAVVELRRALDLGWRHANVHLDLATALNSRDDVDGAVRHIEAWLAMEAPRVRPQPPKSPLATPARDLPFADALLAFADAFEGAGLPFFLGDGTALGVEREGGFIAHDKDIDVGVWAAEVPRERVLQALDESVSFWFDPASSAEDHCLSARYRDLVAIDVFFYEAAHGGVVHGMGTVARPMFWRQTPFGLAPRTVLGRTFLMPDPIDRYLEELYGADWRTPDPDYCAYVTGDIVGGLPPDVRRSALFTLARSIEEGRVAKACSIARRLRERLPDARDETLRTALQVLESRFGSAPGG